MHDVLVEGIKNIKIENWLQVGATLLSVFIFKPANCLLFAVNSCIHITNQILAGLRRSVERASGDISAT